MALVRAPLGYRIVFVVLMLGLFGLMLVVFKTEGTQEWQGFQDRYHAMYKELLTKKARESKRKGDKTDLNRWNRLLSEANNFNGYHISQVFLPDAGVRDLCQTCHMTMENTLFKNAPNPLRSHPEAILHHHKPNRFGCTPCHQGQGVGLTKDKAHGIEKNWPLPRVPEKYVQGLCLGCHESPFGLKGAEKAEKGRTLFIEHGCFGCHETRTLRALPHMSTPYEGIGTKIYNAAWLFQWIKGPSEIRPRTIMPTFRLKAEQISHLVAYLISEKALPKRLAQYDRKKASAKKGKEIFTKKGCIACHSDQRKEPCLTDRVPNLGDAALKLNSRWIVTWLQDPSGLSPETAMPRLMLTDEDRRDLTAYLKSLFTKQVNSRLKTTPKNALTKGNPVEGKRLVQSMGCYGCHGVKDMDQLSLPGVGVADVARKRLDELPFGDSRVPRTKWDWLFYKIKQPDIYKTKDMPLKMPDYRLSDDDIQSLTVFYVHNDYYDLPRHYLSKNTHDTNVLSKGEWMLGQYNCAGCHQMKEDAIPRITRYLGLKSMIPPRLIGEAERLQPQWFFQFLSRPPELRPWLNIRMPEFKWSYQDREDFISYFALQLDKKARKMASIPYELLPVRDDYDPEILEMGKYRVQTDKCMQCHPISLAGKLPEGVKLEDLSINLMLAKSRLRFEWIKDFLRNPDKYAGKATKMPFVFYTPDRIPRISDPEMWIQYTALYLMFMDKAPEMPKEKKIEDIRPGADVDWTKYQ